MAIVQGDGFSIPIIVDDDVAIASFARLQKQAKQFSKSVGMSADKSSTGFSKIQSSIITLNQSMELARKAAIALDAAMLSNIKKFAAYETALVGVGKTTNLSGANLKSFGSVITNLSEQIPVSANELLGLSQIAGQLGVTGSQNLTLFSDTIARLGVSSDLSGDEAATALTRILNVTNQGIGDIDEFASVIVRLGNNFAATESEIARMATEVSRSTAVFGVSAAEAAGISTAMKSLGIQAQLGGSAVGRAFREIDIAIRKGGEGLRALEEITGESGESLREQFGDDAVKVFQSFVKGLDKVQKAGGSVAFALEDLNLKGDEINKVIPVLAQRSDLLADALNQANEEFKNANALTQESQRAFNTTASRIKKLENSFTNLSAAIGEKLAPAFNKTLDDLSRIANALRRTFDKMNFSVEDLSGKIDSLSTSIAVLGTVAGAASIASFVASIGGLKRLSDVVPAIQLFVGSLSGAGMLAGLANVAILSVKLFAAATAALALVAAVDVIIRNLGNLGNLFKFVGNGIFLILNKISFEIKKKVQLPLAEMILTAEKGMAAIGLSTEENVIKAMKDVQAVQIGITEQIQEQIDTTKEMQTQAEKIDFGLIGDAVKFATEGMSAFAKEIEDAAKSSGKLSEDLGSLPEPKTPGSGGGSNQSTFKPPVLFDDDQLALLRNGLGDTLGGFASTLSTQMSSATAPLGAALGAAPLAFMAAADMFADAIQQIIDWAPNFINKVADIFTSLTNLPDAIMDATKNLHKAVLGFISDFIPNLVDHIGESLMEVLTFLGEMIPEAVTKLGEAIPEALTKLVEMIPDIGVKLGMAIVNTDPILLYTRIIAGLIKGTPKLTKALIENFLKGGLIAGVAQGIIEAVKDIINTLANAFGFEDIFDLDKVGEDFKNMGDEIQRSSSNLFEVIDANAQARGLDVADRIRNAIASGGTQINTLFDRMIKALVDAWRFVYSTFLEPWIDILQLTWDGIWKTFEQTFGASMKSLQIIWDGIFEVAEIVFGGIGKVFSNIWETSVALFDNTIGVFKDVWDIVLDIFNGKLGIMEGIFMIGDTIFKGFTDSVKILWDSFKTIGGVVVDTLGAVFNSIGNTLSDLGEVFLDLGGKIWEGLKSGLSGVGDVLSKAFEGLQPDNLFAKMFGNVDFKGQGAIEKALGFDMPFLKFAHGGVIPGRSSSDSEMNDRILALLSPGEAVIPATKMSDPGIAGLVQAIIDGDLDPARMAFGGVIGEGLSRAGKAIEETTGIDIASLDPSQIDFSKINPEQIGKAVQQALSDGFNGAKSGLDTLAKMRSDFGRDVFGLGDINGMLRDKFGEMFNAALAANKSTFGGGGTPGIVYTAQNGGIVPGSGIGDRIPSLLESGEAVINKKSTKMNMKALSSINEGGVVGGTGETTFNITINAKTNLDADSIRREIVPVMERELKKASLRGRFVMAESGIRKGR